MALKAGRVGVAPDQVDEFGKINSEATEGYTKQEADTKFETQSHAASTYETQSHAASTYETKSDAAALQPIQLSVPIEMLSGTALTVENALQGLAGDKVDDTLASSACTDFSETITDVNENIIKKFGKVVNLMLNISGVTCEAGTVLAVLPEGYRPITAIVITVRNTQGVMFCDVLSSGTIKTKQNLSNSNCQIDALWLTN